MLDNPHTTDVNHLAEGGGSSDSSARVANHPVLPGGVNVVTGEVIGFFDFDIFDGVGNWSFQTWIPGWPFYKNTDPYLHSLGPTFDQPDARGTQWIDGDYDVPPQAILDLATATRGDFTIAIKTPWGDYDDTFTLERGQQRNSEDNDTMVIVPDDLALLDYQAAYYSFDSGGEPVKQHQFRHPSWSLLMQRENKTVQTTGWNFGGEIYQVYTTGDVELETPSSILVIDEVGGDPFPFVIRFNGYDRRQVLTAGWSLGSISPAHSNAGHPAVNRAAWRTSLQVTAMAAEYSRLQWSNEGETQFWHDPAALATVAEEAAAYIAAYIAARPPDIYLWVCTPAIEGRENRSDNDCRAALDNDTITASKAKPFPTPPVFSFKATAFVKDFLDFEFK